MARFLKFEMLFALKLNIKIGLFQIFEKVRIKMEWLRKLAAKIAEEMKMNG